MLITTSFLLSFSAQAVDVPLSASQGWQSLTFSSIPSNKIDHSEKGLKVSVDKSASPLIYSFPKPLTIKSVSSSGQFLGGTLGIKDLKKQGLKKSDDFVYRLGLVLEGSRTLSWIERRIAPSWIKKMHSLAPKGSGVSHILFLEVAQSKELVGTKRDHYFSESLKEEIVASLNENGQFQLQHNFEKPVKVLGLWLSIDGDDTKSKFDVLIKDIQLTEDTNTPPAQARL